MMTPREESETELDNITVYSRHRDTGNPLKNLNDSEYKGLYFDDGIRRIGKSCTGVFFTPLKMVDF